LGAVAVIVAEPKEPLVIEACVAGAVCPAGIWTVVVARFTFEESLEFSATVTPPAGAATGSVTANGTVCPGARVMAPGSPIGPFGCTVTSACTCVSAG
jgi:hypothetical protein